jgi:hypothetical protein
MRPGAMPLPMMTKRSAIVSLHLPPHARRENKKAAN